MESRRRGRIAGLLRQAYALKFRRAAGKTMPMEFDEGILEQPIKLIDDDMLLDTFNVDSGHYSSGTKEKGRFRRNRPQARLRERWTTAPRFD